MPTSASGEEPIVTSAVPRPVGRWIEVHRGLLPELVDHALTHLRCST